MVEKTYGSGLWPQMFEPFRQFGAKVADWLTPASEASAGEDTYTITIELPGVEEKDIELTVNDDMVTVKGEKRTSREEKGDTWFFSERQYGAFARSFRLPADADTDRIEADLKDGVLTITVPKSGPKEAAAKTIKIRKA